MVFHGNWGPPTSPKLSRKRVFTSKPPGTETNLEPRTQRISEQFGDAKMRVFLKELPCPKSIAVRLHYIQVTSGIPTKVPFFGRTCFFFWTKTKRYKSQRCNTRGTAVQANLHSGHLKGRSKLKTVGWRGVGGVTFQVRKIYYNTVDGRHLVPRWMYQTL